MGAYGKSDAGPGVESRQAEDLGRRKKYDRGIINGRTYYQLIDACRGDWCGTY